LDRYEENVNSLPEEIDLIIDEHEGLFSVDPFPPVNLVKISFTQNEASFIQRKRKFSRNEGYKKSKKHNYKKEKEQNIEWNTPEHSSGNELFPELDPAEQVI